MTLKLRKKTLFPALVTAESPIVLTKAGSVYDFSLNADQLAETLDPFYLKKHLVIYTVAPFGATANDKARADYVCDGTNDQVAIASAFAAAGASNSAVVALPGSYAFSDTLNIPAGTNNYFYAEGTTFNGPGGTKDTVSIASMIRCNYYFGTINHTGTGSAIHAVQFANGSWISWQELHGTSHQGKGLFVDASTTGSSTGYIRSGWLHGFDKGIHFYSKTTIDTHVLWLNYGFDCNWVIYDETDVGASVQSNAMTWYVNLDTAWSGSASFAGIWTNGHAHVINGTVGSTVGGTYGPNIKLDTLHGFAASAITLNVTPLAFAHESGNVVNSSGNIDHVMNVGMPISLATGGYGNHLAKWSGGNPGQLDDTGISFGAPVGTNKTILYFSATGVVSSLSTANSGVLVTDGTGTPSISSTLPNALAMGTPASITLTNATGLPIASGVAGLGTGIATFLATPSSANLRAALTDEVGTGATYFVGGALGTPASGTATNLTGLPISTGLTGAGTGVLAALGNAINASGGFVTYSGNIGNPIIVGSSNPTGGGALGFNVGVLNYGDGVSNHVLVSTDQTQTLSSKTLTTPVVTSYTVATLPAGSAGMMAWCSNCRVFNGAGVQEGAGAGTGGLVTHNGTAWKIAGTNVTAVA